MKPHSDNEAMPRRKRQVVLGPALAVIVVVLMAFFRLCSIAVVIDLLETDPFAVSTFHLVL